MSLFNINKVFVSGHVAADPEIRTFDSGTAVANFAIGVNRGKKVGDEWENESHFFDITAWEYLARITEENLKKGSPVTIEGELVQDKWVDKQSGENRYKVKIVATKIMPGQRREPVPVGAPPVEASDLFEGRDEEEPF